jgi:Zn finger protein HypA/HybF involved in hydrogenase expression
MNIDMYSPPKPEIEAICKECGQKYAEGTLPDVHPYDPVCPECGSDNLEFPRPRD